MKESEEELKSLLIRVKEESEKVGLKLNMSANLENSAVATGLEKDSFHSSPKKGRCQGMFKVPYNHANFTC